MQKIWRLFRLLPLIILALPAGNSFYSPQASKAKTMVPIVMAPYFGSWLCSYAITNRLITSEQVELVIDQSIRFDDQMLAGNYPIGVMNTGAFAIAANRGRTSLKALSVYLAHTGIQKTDGVAVVYTGKNSSLASPRDLAGRKIGVPGLQGGITSTFLGLLQDDYGIAADQLTLVDSPLPQLISLLKRGDLDAILLLGDPSVQAYYDADCKVLWNVDHAFQAKYGTTNPASFLVVQADYLANNRDQVRAVYDLLQQGRNYGEAHLVELSQRYAAEFGGKAEFYQNAYRRHYSVTFAPVAGKLQDSVMAIFAYTKGRGIISTLPDPMAVF
jgi:ABC-type nitrate/sulfonate/bicarbonate transport system substrate-binding protein